MSEASRDEAAMLIATRYALDERNQQFTRLRLDYNKLSSDYDALIAKRDHLQNGFNAAVVTVEALRLQLSRAKEWMQHEPRCNIHDHHFGGMPSCTCGLTEFLKEVWV